MCVYVYVTMTCCGREDHVESYGSDEFENELLVGMENLTKLIDCWGCENKPQ
jgi:hypothetical protein